MSTRIQKLRRPALEKLLEPRKCPVQRRSQATVEQLLVAAVQVFEEHGYAGTTTNRVAARAGVSVGTLYQYFPNKEALAVALLERHLAETRRRVNDWAGATLARPRDLRHALQTYVEAMLEGYLRGPPRDRAGPQGGRGSSGRRR